MSTREDILRALKGAGAAWLSGGEIGGAMNISRTAIWKAVNALREQGYAIESCPRKGYRLVGEPDVVTPAEIRSGLETEVFGRGEILFFDETDSTNSRAIECAEKGCAEGTLVIAESQSGGRGRLGRKWLSPKGTGVYLSMVLRPAMDPRRASSVTLVTALALAEALKHLGKISLTIKWPNDLLSGGKKLAGILTEMSAEIDAVNYLVIGVGVNVHTAVDDMPEEIRPIATSFAAAAGKTVRRARVVREFLKRFERYYRLFCASGFPAIRETLIAESGFLGQRVQVSAFGARQSGTVIDIDANGVLILRDDEGAVHEIISGDVAILP
jgi:BirA family biotin operon repressor/biotin-[acetyl-CoA-carboxylase] ligase